MKSNFDQRVYLLTYDYRHVGSRGAGGGSCPPDFGRSEGADGSGGGAPHYYLPPQIFRLCDMPGLGAYISTQVIMYMK